MSINPLKALRASILHAKAGASVERGDYVLARRQIEEVKRLLGAKLLKPSLFEIHVRAADVYWNTGDVTSALEHIYSAMKSIEENSQLSDRDREYLLDYCDHFIADIDKGDRKLAYRIHGKNYGLVSSRFRRAYPLIWKEPD